jgi:signal transduction histidine kinase
MSSAPAVPGQRRPDEPRTDLPSAVLTLAEAEADAAADALHDGALQALVVARYAADAAVRGGDAAVARDAVQDALVALRRAVWLLRPRGEQGLIEALEQLAAQVVEAGGAPVLLDVDEVAAAVLDTSLAPAAATAAYRLVQRAAGAAPLTVRLRRTPTGLRIALDVPLTDPAGEALRARAVGGALLATRDGASLHLPLSRSLTPLHAVRPEVLR